MTKKVLLILILLLILLIFYLPFYFFKKPPKKLDLKIEGRYFKNEKEEIIQLKGISTMAFNRNNYPYMELKKKLRIFKNYKINLITFYISPDILVNTMKELDSLVKWSEDNSVYLYLVPTIGPDDIEFTSKRRADLLNLSLSLIKKYKNKTHILYGLWAEPNNINWIDWESYYQEFIDKAVAINSRVILGIAGVSYGREFIENLDFGYKNIFLDFHDYPAANIEELKKKNIKEFLWGKYIKNYPIIIGEFGGVYYEGFGEKEDLDYFLSVIDNANKNKLSYVGYTIDSFKLTGGLSLIDWETNQLTKKGEIFVKSLSDN